LDELEKRLEVLFELEKYDELLKLAFENLHSSEESELLLYTYIIIAFMNTGEYKKALEFCQKSLGIYPEIAYILSLKAKIHMQLSELKEAKKSIEEALQLNANDAEYYLVESRIYFELSNFVEAKKSIDRALELDSTNLDYHIVNAMALYMLDGEKVAKEIIEEVLAKEPNNIKALDVKQNFFTYKLKEKKSILQSMLFLNPFDKESQKDLKFIHNYYRYIPALMSFTIVVSFIFHTNRLEFLYLESYLPFLYLALMLIGSNDWRFNIPFVAIMMGINTYYTNIPDGLELADYLAIAFISTILNFFMMAVFPFVIMWKNRLIKLIKGFRKWQK